TEMVAAFPLFPPASAAPLLSSGGDGTVWLLDGAGVPRRLAWPQSSLTFVAKAKSTSVVSVAAANIHPDQCNSADLHGAGAVTREGRSRRSYGRGWEEVHAALSTGTRPPRVRVTAMGWVFALDLQGRLYRNLSWPQPPAPPANQAYGLLATGQDRAGTLF